MNPTAIAILCACIGGASGVAGTILGWLLTKGDRSREGERHDAITLAQVAAAISRIDDRLRDHGLAIDGACEDVAYIAGSLGVGLPSRR